MIDQPVFRNGMRSTVTVDSLTEIRTNAPTIAATKSVITARMDRPGIPESLGIASGKEAMETVTPVKSAEAPIRATASGD